MYVVADDWSATPTANATPNNRLGKIERKARDILKPFSLFGLSRYVRRLARHCWTGLNESGGELILPTVGAGAVCFSGQFGIWPLHCLLSKIAVPLGLIFARWQKGLALPSSEPMMSTNCTLNCLAGEDRGEDALDPMPCRSSCYGVRTAGVEFCNMRSRSACRSVWVFANMCCRWERTVGSLIPSMSAASLAPSP